MSTKLGTLTLDLVAKVGSFVEGMNKAERKAKDTSNNIKKSFKSFGDQIHSAIGGTQIGSAIEGITGKLGSLRGGVLMASSALTGMAIGGIVLATGALGKMAIDLANADAQLNQLSRRALTSAENFQIVSGAAKAFGVEQGKLSDILADTSEKLGEYSSTKGGGAKDFFEMLTNNTRMSAKEIDLFAKKLSTIDTVDALGEITTKLDDMGATAAEKRFVLESLASDLGDLAPLFEHNSELIKEYGDQLREAGVVRTQESIDKSLILNAQTQALGTQFEGFKNQLASQMTPVLSNLIQYFVDGAIKSGSFGTVLSSVGTVAKVVGIAIVGVASAISVVIQSIDGFARLISHVGNVASKMDAATSIKEQINVLKTGFGDGKAIWVDTASGIDKTINSMMRFVGNVKTTTMPTLTGLSAAQLKVNQANLANSKSTITDTEMAKENAKAKQNQTKETVKLAKAQEDLNKMVGVSALSGLRIKSSEAFAGGGVRAYTANFAQLAQKQLGSDLARFTAFNDLYHKGTNSKHATGNAFDFTIADPSKSAQAVAQLESVAKRYGYVVKILDEYKVKTARSTGGHLHVSVLGFNGTAEAAKQAQEELNLVAKTNEESTRIQLSVVKRFMSDREKLELEHTDSLREIQDAFFEDSSTRDKYIALQQAMYNKDVHEFEKAEQEKASARFAALNNPLSEMHAMGMNAIAQSTLGPSALQGWQRNNEQQAGYSQLGDSFNLARTAIEDNQFLSESERYAELESLYENYLMNKAALAAQYAVQEKEVAQQQHLEQIGLWGNILNQAQNTFAQLTQSVKDSAGEQSGVYRAMFAMQQIFSIGSSYLAANTAYTQAFADPSAMTLPQKFAGAASVMAALMPAITSISTMSLDGMAHNGIDNIPREGTWLLDGGERVLNPQQNKDLTNYLANSKQDSAKITIINNSGAQVNARQGANGEITIDVVEDFVRQSLANPNSRISKALSSNTNAGRRR